MELAQYILNEGYLGFKPLTCHNVPSINTYFLVKKFKQQYNIQQTSIYVEYHRFGSIVHKVKL